MLTLLEQQQKLLEILRRRRQADTETSGPDQTGPDPTRLDPANGLIDSDPWLASVICSRGLLILHQAALWWQHFQIESSCRYTSRLMKRLGCFESYLTAHFTTYPAAPAIEDLTAQFLTLLAEHENPLLRAVAQFELFCVGSAEATSGAVTIVWDRDPEAVMVALDRFQPLPEPAADARYHLHLSSNNPAYCIRESLLEA
jgi:hypothetical protein